jgi:RNA polymerase sigma-70 factor, ECF subfamily
MIFNYRVATHGAAHGVPDTALMAAVISRDEAALSVLSERYRRLLYAIALRITRDSAVAEEVVQDTLYAVWRSAGQFQPERNLTAWLCSLARHRAVDTLRSRTFRARQREQTLLDEQAAAPFLAAENHADTVLLRETLRAAIDTLEPAQRRLVQLAYYGGLTQTELAAQLGLPLGTVKSRLRAAMAILRERLEPVVFA